MRGDYLPLEDPKLELTSEQLYGQPGPTQAGTYRHFCRKGLKMTNSTSPLSSLSNFPRGGGVEGRTQVRVLDHTGFESHIYHCVTLGNSLKLHEPCLSHQWEWRNRTLCRFSQMNSCMKSTVNIIKVLNESAPHHSFPRIVLVFWWWGDGLRDRA